MKKIFTLIATALLTMGASAQTTVFSATPLQDLTENWSTPTGETEITATYATISGGKMFTVNEQDAAKEMIKKQGGEYAFQCTNNNTYFKVVLSEALQVGDVISARLQSRTDTDLGLFFAATSTRPSETTTAIILPTAAEQAWGDAPTYTVATGDGICGETTFYIYRATGKSTYFNTFAITRAGGGGGDEPGGGSSEGEWTANVDYVSAPGGTMSAEFAAATPSGTNLIATIVQDPITLEYVAAKEPQELTSEQGGAAGLTQDNWPEAGWKAASYKIGGNNKESQPTLGDGFYSVIGTGVPFVSFVSKQFWNDTDGFADRYYPGFKADTDTDGWTYYNPDGSKGLPTSGAYIKAKTTTAGVMKIGCFVQAGNTRQLYIARESDKKVLNWTADNNTEYKIEGYAQDVKNSDGSWQFIPAIPVEDYLIGSSENYNWTDPITGDTNSKNVQNSRKFIWFVFDADPTETYYIFGKNWQIGFQGVKFYTGKSIKDYDPTGIEVITTKTEKVWNADAPMYNLSGQKVDKSYKGIVIQNGRKFVNK